MSRPFYFLPTKMLFHIENILRTHRNEFDKCEVVEINKDLVDVSFANADQSIRFMDIYNDIEGVVCVSDSGEIYAHNFVPDAKS